jgi:hypothetical protein
VHRQKSRQGGGIGWIGGGLLDLEPVETEGDWPSLDEAAEVEA